MADLFLHGRPVKTVFDLLGDKENDITFSIGWALAQCDAFVNALLGRLLPGLDAGEVQSIQLQQAGGSGFTDIEIVADHVHIIIEAKRGWDLPENIAHQLTKYASRFSMTSGQNLLVVMSEGADYYALPKLPQSVETIPVRYLSWRDVAATAKNSQQGSSHANKRLLQELVQYLNSIMNLQNQTSNQVYVVALAGGTPDWSALSWRDIVTEHDRYFHPVGGSGWPKIPPNYIGFRYDGRLQCIRHIEGYSVIVDTIGMAAAFPAMLPAIQEGQETFAKAHFLYKLGPAIAPAHEVRTGNVFRNGRVWAALDLLLTSRTISDARDSTQQRAERES